MNKKEQCQNCAQDECKIRLQGKVITDNFKDHKNRQLAKSRFSVLLQQARQVGCPPSEIALINREVLEKIDPSRSKSGFNVLPRKQDATNYE
jgi:hypothetical protein